MVDSSLENIVLSTDGGLYAHRIAVLLRLLFVFCSNAIANINNYASPPFILSFLYNL